MPIISIAVKKTSLPELYTLKVETAAWDTWNTLLCDRCSCDEIQDEAHALLVRRDANVCALRRKYAYLFNCFSGDFSMEQPILQQASVQDAFDFLLQHNNQLFSFVSELMDIVLTGEDQSQANQPNSLANMAEAVIQHPEGSLDSPGASLS
eukprot:1150062-Pelagomonas_calceolata.AAC.1